MIVPVRCFTCAKVLSDKWRAFEARHKKALEASDAETPHNPESGLVGVATAKILDEMKITRLCCRRVMMTTVDAMHRI